MKSFFIWVFGMIIGAGLGYGLSFLLDINFLLLMSAGIILGSSAAITINIFRKRDELELQEIEEEMRAASQESEE